MSIKRITSKEKKNTKENKAKKKKNYWTSLPSKSKEEKKKV